MIFILWVEPQEANIDDMDPKILNECFDASAHDVNCDTQKGRSSFIAVKQGSIWESKVPDLWSVGDLATQLEAWFTATSLCLSQLTCLGPCSRAWRILATQPAVLFIFEIEILAASVTLYHHGFLDNMVFHGLRLLLNCSTPWESYHVQCLGGSASKHSSDISDGRKHLQGQNCSVPHATSRAGVA